MGCRRRTRFRGCALSNGGAGGFIGGLLPVSAGDVFTVWVGQGGLFGFNSLGGLPSIGSYYGVAARGGDGSTDILGDGGGGGGGLTTIQQTGSVSLSFLVPGGGGASDQGPGMDVVFGAGGGAGANSGVDAFFDTTEGGGGAGEDGGVGGAFPTAGTYEATVPTGLSRSDGSGGIPASSGNTIYNLCRFTCWLRRERRRNSK